MDVLKREREGWSKVSQVGVFSHKTKHCLMFIISCIRQKLSKHFQDSHALYKEVGVAIDRCSNVRDCYNSVTDCDRSVRDCYSSI